MTSVTHMHSASQAPDLDFDDLSVAEFDQVFSDSREANFVENHDYAFNPEPEIEYHPTLLGTTVKKTSNEVSVPSTVFPKLSEDSEDGSFRYPTPRRYNAVSVVSLGDEDLFSSPQDKNHAKNTWFEITSPSVTSTTSNGTATKPEGVSSAFYNSQNVASVFNKPSFFIRQALSSNRNAETEATRPVKRTKTTPALEQSLLHRTVCKGNTTVEAIEAILKVDPEAASRAVTIKTVKDVYNHIRCVWTKKEVNEPYSYPLHLAIKYKASSDVIEKLVNAAPAVLLQRDGRMQESPLAVLLRYWPSHVEMMDKFIMKVPRCVAIIDRHNNTPLHIACMYGSTLNVVKHLCIMYPEAKRMSNFHARTPFNIACERTATCSHDVSNFLLYKSQSS